MEQTQNKQDPFEIGVSQMEKFMDRYELKKLHVDFFQKVTLLIIASLGFISAIAWDQFLKIVFAEVFGSVDSIWTKLLYAVIITLIAVLISIVLTKIFLSEKTKK